MLFRRTMTSWMVMVASVLGGACVSNSRAKVEKPELRAVLELPREGTRTNLDSLRAYLDTFSRGPLHTRVRRAVCADRPAGKGCVDSVTIEAIGSSRDIKANAGPSPGRVIGRIRNLDSRDPTEMYSLKPVSQAEYYVYIDRAPSGAARWNLLEVPKTGAGTIRKIVLPEVKPCGEKPGYEWQSSDVDFANCGDHALQGMVTAEMFTPAGLLHFFSLLGKKFRANLIADESYVWYACSNGCCSSSM